MMLTSKSRLLRSVPVVLLLLAAQTGCGAGAVAAASPAMSVGPMSARSGEAAPAGASAADAPAGYPMASPAPQAPAAPSPAQPAAPARLAPGASPASLASPAKGAPDTHAAKNAGPSTRAPVIIYQGDLHMVADEDAIPKTIDKVIDVAESLGGHIAGRKDQSVQIKVPSASFREAMTKIEALGGVTGRSVTADDVSEEFHDLEVRLGNLRGTRARLQEFLTKANGIQDMLTVERELERVALEIDRIEGRLEFLRTRAAMSTISIALTAKPKVTPIVATTPPPPRSGVDLPIPWVGEVGIDPLLTLRK